MVYVFLLLTGFLIGSFLSVLTYRLPRRMQFISGRSRCPQCKHKILWYDNIPLFSFLFLRGKCRNCHRRISIRYPLLEFVTGVTFVVIGPNISYLVLAAIFICVFVIDIEHQIIPDELVFLGLAVVILNLKFEIFNGLFAGFLAADFLLLLNIVTKGKGMGLGDVKLAILIGSIIGLRYFLLWLLVSFVIGAIVGIILIIFRKANLKEQIAFGPFLIIGMVVTKFFI